VATDDPRSGVVDNVPGLTDEVRETATHALSWLIPEDGSLTGLSQSEVQLFLWYRLPTKWLVDVREHHEIAWSLGDFFATAGLPRYAELCRAPLTHRRRARLVTGRGRNLSVSALGRKVLTDPHALVRALMGSFLAQGTIEGEAASVAGALLLAEGPMSMDQLSSRVAGVLAERWRDREGRPSMPARPGGSCATSSSSGRHCRGRRLGSWAPGRSR